jgi:hypothetical protein
LEDRGGGTIDPTDDSIHRGNDFVVDITEAPIEYPADGQVYAVVRVELNAVTEPLALKIQSFGLSATTGESVALSDAVDLAVQNAIERVVVTLTIPPVLEATVIQPHILAVLYPFSDADPLGSALVVTRWNLTSQPTGTPTTAPTASITTTATTTTITSTKTTTSIGSASAAPTTATPTSAPSVPSVKVFEDEVANGSTGSTGSSGGGTGLIIIIVIACMVVVIIPVAIFLIRADRSNRAQSSKLVGLEEEASVVESEAYDGVDPMWDHTEVPSQAIHQSRDQWVEHRASQVNLVPPTSRNHGQVRPPPALEYMDVDLPPSEYGEQEALDR